MGYWSMFYAQEEYKRTHPWLFDKQRSKSKKEDLIEWLLWIAATLLTIGVSAAFLWLTCPIFQR